MAKKTTKLKTDEVSLFELFMNEIDYDAMNAQRRQDLIQTLMMLLACVEDEQLNMNKVAALVERISGGRMNFPT
jgi:hypothetical protein